MPQRIIVAADAYGNPLREALVPYLQAKGLEVEDLGEGPKYYELAAEVGQRVAAAGDDQTMGVLFCGTGMGMSIVSNKVPGVRAAVCESQEAAANSRSINNSNVLALGAMVTQPEPAKAILDTFLATAFKGYAPANRNEGWDAGIQTFLDQSMGDIRAIEQAQAQSSGKTRESSDAPCPACALASERHYEKVEGVPGATWSVVRQEPTRAYVRFRKGAIEPAHHHTHGHDVFVLSGSKRVENVTLGMQSELRAGDYLYTAGGRVHRVVYHEDTEYIISSDGLFDIFWAESQPSAAVDK